MQELQRCCIALISRGTATSGEDSNNIDNWCLVSRSMRSRLHLQLNFNYLPHNNETNSGC